ncbi:MAG: UvrD-helicase domain-containing protein [Rhodocyclaceae bacterium]|nr:UvrD-helicase domain-containing protein [Rhodocyclaceae bacterium]MCA3075579.1 UvrD-helicase domain-containing protein [Rhodocyclaceae bacterium]MCA3092067.1 UvrD-helicase domain-containing protein [Rhodocyclaceae bacterium]MCA3095976.1 UvrD-helicase domain-containing protein [Rhodocyclaceae bacterium]MCA3099579.1 UvrD-helicase domain-containing protein [Rhodocyclaceae bacterium]
MQSRLLENLNPEQLAAVTLPRESAMILAGAGSGKTRVLTTRIAWLIETRQVNPLGLLAVTFTNKAAREMLTRISAMLPINTRGMWVGTFHGLANRMLRAHHRDAGLPQTFQIMDTADQVAMVKRMMKANGIDEERFKPRDTAWFISAQKDAGLRPGSVEAFDDHTRQLVEIYTMYEAQCQREGVTDFAELILRSYELLARNEAIREHYRARFAHILVDEFQDTNRLQFDWLKLIAGSQNAVFAVGDDDQSVYSFRGAKVANMRDFEREFNAGTIIKLEQNYRSHGNILEAANVLIGHNQQRLGKNLWTSESQGEPIRLFEAQTDFEEAQFVVEQVRDLKATGVPLVEVALLYRSNAQSRVLEHALFSAGLPYRVYGGLRFFERQEIKHALAYLRLVANPDDDAALLRVINFPTRGIGARSIEQLQDAARAGGTSLWQAACSRGGTKGGSPDAPRKGVEGFVLLIDRLRNECAGITLPEMIEAVIERSGLRTHYDAEREGADRIANLDELVNAAAQFSDDPMRLLEMEADADSFASQGPTALAAAALDEDAAEAEADAAMLAAGFGDMPGLPPGDADAGIAAASGTAPAPAEPTDQSLIQFLSHASLEAGDNQANAGDDALQLMTVHAAKGLEFHTVFASGLEEGLFPHENSLNDAGGVEEERRLMYVAVTRARRRLYLTFAQSRMLHGQTRYNVASRFLREIPVKLLKRLSPTYERGGGSTSFDRPRTPASYAAVQVQQAPKIEAVGMPFRIGQNVRHAKFGGGVIIDAEGRGSDARVQVNFGREGVKWLALAYAKLDPA